MEKSRNQEHFAIMTIIYDEIVDLKSGKIDSFRDVRGLACDLLNLENFDLASDYVKQMLEASLKNYGKIVEAFIPLLKGWKWDRLPNLTQSILVMSYAHYYFVEKVDKKIVINIAVKLAKSYVDEKQAKFINGILDEALK